MRVRIPSATDKVSVDVYDRLSEMSVTWGLNEVYPKK